MAFVIQKLSKEQEFMGKFNALFVSLSIFFSSLFNVRIRDILVRIRILLFNLQDANKKYFSYFFIIIF